MRLQSQTPEEWARTLRDRPNDASFRALRERPIFTFARDRAIIFDPAFYLDNLTTAPLFQVMSQGVSSNQVFGAFGLAFEDYVIGLLRRRFPSSSGLLHERLRCNVQGETAAGQAFEIDTSRSSIELRAAGVSLTATRANTTAAAGFVTSRDFPQAPNRTILPSGALAEASDTR